MAPGDLDPATDAGLRELGARFGLGDRGGQALRTLLLLLNTDPLAPTAVREPHEGLGVHLADSLVALELAPVRAAGTIADIGSGAGLPALPLAIALPAAVVTAVESNARKCAFIGRAASACGLRNVEVRAVRAESFPPPAGGFDLVTARALAELDVVAEYAAPLLRLGGSLIAWRGRRDAEAEAAAARACALLGLEVAEVRAVKPYRGSEHRHLHVIRKLAPTPRRFPRRPGIARKRPLGSIATASDRDRR
jgi:16S rRNA (guanine527-N7)-methyltransferase